MLRAKNISSSEPNFLEELNNVRFIYAHLISKLILLENAKFVENESAVGIVNRKTFRSLASGFFLGLGFLIYTTGFESTIRPKAAEWIIIIRPIFVIELHA